MQPVSLKMENFLSHSNSELNFEFTSALIVGAYDNNDRLSNGAGKSSIFEAIAWALFGQSRHKNSDDVVKRGEAICRVELLFTHAEHKYRIVRTRNMKYSRMEVQFEMLDGDGSVNLTRDTNRLTDAEIRKTIKSTYEIFINSSYFRQNMGFDFAEGTFSSRQALIGTLLNLARWNEYQELAKTELKQSSESLESLKKELKELETAEAGLQVVEQASLDLETQAKDLSRKEASLNDSIEDLEGRLSSNAELKEDLSKFQDLQNKASRLTNVLTDADRTITLKLASLEKADKDLLQTQEAIKHINQEVSELERAISDQDPVNLDVMEQGLLDGKAKRQAIVSQVVNLSEHDECVMCGHYWDDPVLKNHEISRRKEYLKELDQQLERASEALRRAKDHMSRLRNAELEIVKKTAQLEKAESSTEFLELKKESLEHEIEVAKKQSGEYRSDLEDLEARLDSLSHVKEAKELLPLEQQLQQKKQELKALKGQQTSLTFALGQNSQKQEHLQERIRERSEVRNLISQVSRKATVYGRLSRVFSKDGVQAIIIDNVIEDLTRIINQWLVEFCTEPTYINFITQKKNTKGDWRETLDIEVVTPSGISKFESLSGGEKFRVGFAIRLAMSFLQARRMGGEVQILLLDEVSTSLDAAGLETFMGIIRKLEREVKVMLITHDDKLKEEFGNIITVRRTADGSKIEE